MPGFGQNYAINGNQNMSSGPGSAPVSANGLPVSQAGPYYPQTATGGFPQYPSTSQAGQMGPPIMDNNGMVADYNTNQTVGTPTQYQSSSSQQVSPVQDLTNGMDQTPTMATSSSQAFDTPYFDANDPSMYNFNISDLNFGNHYGALEFSMLGHLSGAVNTPEMNRMNSMGGHSHQGSVSYDGTSSFSGPYNHYNQTFPSWQSVPHAASRQNSSNNIWETQHIGEEAFAIKEQPPSLTGASPQSQQEFPGHQSSNTSPETPFATSDQTDMLRQSLSQSRKQGPFPGNPSADVNSSKGRRNASDVYSMVTAPYHYTQGFHALTAFLQRRYPTKKVVRIAKALATVRPSFISTNQHLTQEDLVYMEKFFQRTLCEYDGFLAHYGTPTVLLRRTGEIAAVSKEFCLLTGWRRDVLLGKEPNLNINAGSENISGTQTGTSSRGAATPRVSSVEVDPGRPQPVFLAELMDEDSVVTFYEDFAQVAFGASHATIPCAPCELLKYRTKDDPRWGDEDENVKQTTKHVKHDSLLRGEAGINTLGARDGRVSCQMCWTVKRDVFDFPMLIVMNVS